MSLDLLALELGASERTLRRAAVRGTIRADRSGSRLSVAYGEQEYVRRRWPLIERLLAALRTERGVRAAVLFGSVARGTEDVSSDLDLLVDLRRGGTYADRIRLEERLEAACGRPVQLVALDDAQRVTPLLAEILRDGRVLVDRDGTWARLRRRGPEILRSAEAAAAEEERAAWSVLDRFEELI